MPGNKKPRKAYRRKYAKGTLPITIRQSSEADTALQLVPHTELEKLRDGTADEYTANTMAFRLNWGYVMAGEVFDNPEVRADMELALAAIRSVKARHERTGKWGTTGPEFIQMGEGLKHTDAMQMAATRREQHEALAVMHAVNVFKSKQKEPV
ncbi:MAG: hypothetical protein RL758_128 [Pseudomonadota bacterium]|jgi:hypothetical protein